MSENIAMMPLKKNVRKHPPRTWKLTKCPICGRECYYQQDHGEAVKAICPNIKFYCTECALKTTAESREKERIGKE